MILFIWGIGDKSKSMSEVTSDPIIWYIIAILSKNPIKEYDLWLEWQGQIEINRTYQFSTGTI